MPKIDSVDNAEVGARMRMVRERLRMSQAEFAAMLGTSPQNVRHWEAGRQRITIDQASTLVDRERLTLDWIYLGRWHTLPADIAVKFSVLAPQDGNQRV